MRRLLIALIVVLLGALWLAWQMWQGTAVAASHVHLQPLKQWVVASGEVNYNIQSQISAEITGTVSQRHVREGDWVKQGQLLISLEQQPWLALRDQAQAELEQLTDIRLHTAQTTLKEAQQRLILAKNELKRRQTLAGKGLMSTENLEQTQRQVQDLQADVQRAQLQTKQLENAGSEYQRLTHKLAEAQAKLDKTQIYAPFAGLILTRTVEAGDVVQPNKVLLELAKSDAFEVLVAVDEKSIAPIRVGQTAWVIADAYPEQELLATVDFIAPALDASRGTLDVHVKLTEGNQPLRAGMTTTVSILAAEKQQALVLSNRFIYWQGKQPYVWRYHNNAAEKVPVSLGLRGETQSEISQGLQAEDIVLALSPEQAEKRLKPVFSEP